MRIGKLKELIIEKTTSTEAREKMTAFWNKNGADDDLVTPTLSINFVFAMQMVSDMVRPSMSAIALGVIPKDDPALVTSNEIDAFVSWFSSTVNRPLDQMEDAVAEDP